MSEHCHRKTGLALQSALCTAIFGASQASAYNSRHTQQTARVEHWVELIVIRVDPVQKFKWKVKVLGCRDLDDSLRSRGIECRPVSAGRFAKEAAMREQGMGDTLRESQQLSYGLIRLFPCEFDG